MTKYTVWLYEAQQTKHILSIPPTVPAGLLYSVFVLFFSGDLQMILFSHSSRLQSMNDDGVHRRWSPLYHQIFFDFGLFSGLCWQFLANIIKTFFLCGFSLLAGYFFILPLYFLYRMYGS